MNVTTPRISVPPATPRAQDAYGDTLTPAPGMPDAHLTWCAEHWDDQNVCWAADVAVVIRPDADDNGRGQVTAMMTHTPNLPSGRPARIISLFVDSSIGDGYGLDMDPDEAEVAAHALLAMVATSRGQEEIAQQHRRAATATAAEVLARRVGEEGNR